MSNTAQPRRWTVEYFDDVPVDACGDADLDRAVPKREHFRTRALALRYARGLLLEHERAYAENQPLPLFFGCLDVIEATVRQSKWTRRLEWVEVRTANLSDSSEPIDWRSLPDPDE